MHALWLLATASTTRPSMRQETNASRARRRRKGPRNFGLVHITLDDMNMLKLLAISDLVNYMQFQLAQAVHALRFQGL
eukprot:4034025-Pleurochrysis_carterae.AAC.1